MKKKTVKFVSAVVALGVVSGAYVGVNSYVSSQEKKESEEEDTSVELTSLSTDDITSVAFTAGQDNVEFDKKTTPGRKKRCGFPGGSGYCKYCSGRDRIPLCCTGNL